MIGLLIKDIKNLGSQAKIIAVLIGIYVVFGMQSRDFSMVFMVLAIFAAMMPITSLSYDERAKWDSYALSMPISRREMIISKYLLNVLLAIVVAIVYILMSVLVSGDSFADALSGSLVYVAIAMIYVSVVFPICLKLGVEKGRIAMIATLMLPTLLIVVVLNGNTPELDMSMVQLLLPVAALVLTLVSALISIGIYEKKEF